MHARRDRAQHLATTLLGHRWSTRDFDHRREHRLPRRCKRGIHLAHSLHRACPTCMPWIGSRNFECRESGGDARRHECQRQKMRGDSHMMKLAFGALVGLLVACGGDDGKTVILPDAAPPVMACNPLTQAGCAPDEKCTWLLDALEPQYV